MLPTIIGLIVGFIPVVFIIVFLAVFYYGADPHEGAPYDTSSVRCKALARKLQYFDEDIRYLVTYMNIILPLMAGFILYHIVNSILTDNLLNFIVLAAVFALQVLTVVLIRGIDAVGYVINMAAVISTGAAFAFINLQVYIFGAIDLLIAIWYVVYHIRYFYIRRDLFFKTVRELRDCHEQ